MAERAYWKGHIRLSLVSFPVRLYAAVTQTDKVRLHKIDKDSGSRIHYQNVNEEGEIVDADDIVKGYEYEKGQYVEIEDDELSALKTESRHTIDLIQFTDMASVDPVYYDSPYFIAPDGDIAMEAYVTIRDALKKTGKVALGQIVLGNRERIAAIKPCGKGMLLETLRYNYEVRAAQEYFSGIGTGKPNEEQLDLARQLIQSKTDDFDPRQFKDRYQEGLKEIIEAKLEHRKPDLEDEAPRTAKVVNIMDALRKSLATSEKKKPATRTAAAKAKTPAKKAPPKTKAKSTAKHTGKRKAA